jgi:outer membrane protein Pom
MKQLKLVFLMFIALTEVSYARNVYFFDREKDDNDVSVQVSTKLNQTRKVYVFKDSEIISNKKYKDYSGYTIQTSSLGVDSGYRTGELNWTIGFPDTEGLPDILSELVWSDLDIFQYSIDGEVRLRNKLRFGLELGFGHILDGDNRDSDYLLDNRQGEFSRSISTVGGDEVIDVSAYMGYEFSPNIFQNYKSYFTPLFGYSYHAQNLQFEDGVQVLSNFGFSVPLGPFSGLDSEYRTNWYGPWLGFEFEVNKDQWTVVTRYSHHWVDYEADATWNLRSDFAQPISFEHITDGEADKVSLTFMHHWESGWTSYLDLGLETWTTESGVDRTFFTNGVTAELPFNEANWETLWAGIGIKRYF